MQAETKAEKVIRKELGMENDSRPWVQFFDSAMEDGELTKPDGRQRYKNTIMIEKIPTADGLVVRDKFHRKMHEDDKREFPEAWETYEKRKSTQADAGPSVRNLPGMDAAILEELLSLRIGTCQDLIEYDGDLEELDGLRDIAVKLMEFTHDAVPQSSIIRERREALRAALVRPKDSPSGRSGESGQSRGLRLVNQLPEPLALPEGSGDPVESFSYSFEV